MNENLGQRYGLASQFSFIPHSFFIFQPLPCGFSASGRTLTAASKFLIYAVCYKDTTNTILIIESPANHNNASTTCREGGVLKVFQRER